MLLEGLPAAHSFITSISRRLFGEELHAIADSEISEALVPLKYQVEVRPCR